MLAQGAASLHSVPTKVQPTGAVDVTALGWKWLIGSTMLPIAPPSLGVRLPKHLSPPLRHDARHSGG